MFLNVLLLYICIRIPIYNSVVSVLQCWANIVSCGVVLAQLLCSSYKQSYSGKANPRASERPY